MRRTTLSPLVFCNGSIQLWWKVEDIYAWHLKGKHYVNRKKAYCENKKKPVHGEATQNVNSPLDLLPWLSLPSNKNVEVESLALQQNLELLPCLSLPCSESSKNVKVSPSYHSTRCENIRGCWSLLVMCASGHKFKLWGFKEANNHK